ncbi:FliM/FliN family flagellar motor switch protein [Burkholderia sp. BCC1977]|uniref:FliM/FliN family flagellar motor switch protein n=1 Tax=Burkholderia sp. BCC1977 TaxID=2817440 RepID=UPI002ABDCED6|nr:FliM/FliN family flagellar motor switch protein [Burkholderia sp. BCC1977]
MSTQPVAWRPDSERDLVEARTWLDGALAQWQTRWFVTATFAVDDVVRVPAGMPLPEHDGYTCRAHADGVRFVSSPDADRLLAEAVYAIDRRTFCAPGCHDALTAIATTMIDELADLLRSASDASSRAPAGWRAHEQGESIATPPRYGAVEMSIVSTNGSPLAKVACDVTRIWTLAGTAGTPGKVPPPGETVVPRVVALDDSPVALSVRLGRCRLTAAELATLAIGDVIPLDQALDAPVTLTIDGTSMPVGTGTPGRTGTSLSFQLTSLSTPAAS